MANITVSGSCTVTKGGVTSTLTGSFTADVAFMNELSRDIDSTWTGIVQSNTPLSFVVIVNNGSVNAYWSVIPSGGVATERIYGAVPPGGHVLLPAVIVTDQTGGTQQLEMATASGTTQVFVMYGVNQP